MARDTADLETNLMNSIIADLESLTFPNDASPLFENVRRIYADLSEFTGNNAIIDFDQLFNNIEGTQSDLYAPEITIATRETMTNDQAECDSRIARQDNIMQALREYITTIPNNIGSVNGYQILEVTIINAKISYGVDNLGTHRYLDFKFRISISVDVR